MVTLAEPAELSRIAVLQAGHLGDHGAVAAEIGAGEIELVGGVPNIRAAAGHSPEAVGKGRRAGQAGRADVRIAPARRQVRPSRLGHRQKKRDQAENFCKFAKLSGDPGVGCFHNES